MHFLVYIYQKNYNIYNYILFNFIGFFSEFYKFTFVTCIVFKGKYLECYFEILIQVIEIWLDLHDIVRRKNNLYMYIYICVCVCEMFTQGKQLLVN